MSDDQKFIADFHTLNADKHTINVTLNNGRNQSLFLQTRYISDGIIHIVLKEPDTQRFELKSGWSLKSEQLSKLG